MKTLAQKLTQRTQKLLEKLKTEAFYIPNEAIRNCLEEVMVLTREEAIDECVEALELTYSEHPEYTDATLRYHEKQKKALRALINSL